MVDETREAGATVSLVARRRGVSPNQLFTWRRLAEEGALAATQAEEEVVPASAFRAQQDMIRELQRLLGKKTLETEILKEALEVATAQKNGRCGYCRCHETVPCETLGVARSNIARRVVPGPSKRRGRPALSEEPLLSEITTVIAEMPSYGHPRVWAVLRRRYEAQGDAPANRKRVYRIMKKHCLLLQKHAGGAGGEAERQHDGCVAVGRSNLRWCSDGFEIACDDEERVRVAFALDCRDREAMSHVATTAGIKGGDIRDLMVTAVEQRFGRLNRLPKTIEWLTDNGSCYAAVDTRRFAREIGFLPLCTPIESPQSNGMAEALVRTFKRDYVALNPKPDAATGIHRPPPGSSVTTPCIHTEPLAIDPLANQSLSMQIKPVRAHYPKIKVQQQQDHSLLDYDHAKAF